MYLFYVPQKYHICTIQFGLMWKQEIKVGGLRTAVAPALLLVGSQGDLDPQLVES